jgi:eukaryotic-like serine/threonine-protein kinase
VTLSPGERLGPYEILAPLGAGGMGEVYRARDTRLKRDVAVKMLSDELSRDAEHLARFQREAEMLAALNHPGIAAIYGIEESEPGRFLVLELVPGETLADRLAAGPLPVDQALEITRQVADALASAHEKGIVHRDLKPGNVMITPEGRVKLLDFGLARSFEGPAGGPDSTSPTLTRAGTVLGTPAYMSPEQARGQPLDERSDVWSFGCILYEELTGRAAFGGDTFSDQLAAILRGDPDWNALPHDTPSVVRRLLDRCLEKDAGGRLRNVGEARWALEEALAQRQEEKGIGAAQDRSPTPPSKGAGGSLLRSLRAAFSRPPPPSVVPTTPPRLSQLTFAKEIEAFPGFSPDGSEIIYAREVGRVRKIFRKRLGSSEEVALTRGTFDDIQPCCSADGRSVLFVRSRQSDSRLEPGDVFGQYDGADVWSIDVRSGDESRLVENAFNPAVSPDGTRIALDASWAGPRRLWIVDARGRNPQQVTTDVSEAVVHLRPRWSSDGSRIVFQNLERTRFDVRVVTLASKEMVWTTSDHYADLDPVWSPSGKYLYFSSYRGGGINLWRLPVSANGAPAGEAQQLTTGAGQDIHAALSRDGRRLAFATLKQNADLWKLPVSPENGHATGPPREVVATTREDSRGAWSRDVRRIAFNSDRSGDMNIWIHSLEDGSVRQVTKGPGGDFQPNWSPDEKNLAFFSSRSGHPNIWEVELGSGRLAQLTRNRSIDINPIYSPDGRQIVWQSDRDGRLEIWIMDADGSRARPLTRTGTTGHFLRWTQDGRRIVYRRSLSGPDQMLVVSSEGGEPEPLGAEIAGGSHISFSPDFSRVMDVLGHKTLWVSSLRDGSREKVFEFDDPDVRIDYPVWSPDGRWVLFDRFRPQGGDVWLMEGFE